MYPVELLVRSECVASVQPVVEIAKVCAVGIANGKEMRWDSVDRSVEDVALTLPRVQAFYRCAASYDVGPALSQSHRGVLDPVLGAAEDVFAIARRDEGDAPRGGSHHVSSSYCLSIFVKMLSHVYWSSILRFPALPRAAASSGFASSI